MELLKFENVSRFYQSAENKQKRALDNVSITFPNRGLVAVVGKSGSGKSTLLNLIALFDKCTNGHIFYKGKEISTFSHKKIAQYRNQEIGMIFQHYYLLEKQSSLFNVSLPMLINGSSVSDTHEDTLTLLKGIDFPGHLYKQKCQDLSGGEKERIAILRSLINNPRILLADEPTGALDSSNSLLVMDILKRSAKKKLVILVSHNEKMVRDYADRIITLKDGCVVSDVNINEIDNEYINYENEPRGKHKSWVFSLALHNLKMRLKRNIISYLSLTFSLLCSLLIIGFSNGSPTAVSEQSLRQLDYGVATISKEVSKTVQNSGLSLVQMFKPNEQEKEEIIDKFPNFYVTDNYDALVPINPLIKSEDIPIESLTYQPILSFCDDSFDKSLLINGFIPSKETLNQVIINKTAYEIIKDTGINPLRTFLNISTNYIYHYYPENDIHNEVITDYFVYENNVKIVGVVDELNFLSTPKIYYSFIALENYLSSTYLNNLSNYLEENITWAEIVNMAPVNNELSSYSLRLFLKNYNNKKEMRTYYSNVPSTFTITSTPIMVADALIQLIDVSSVGMEIFLGIAILGSALILGIVSFASYSEDKKDIAILLALGAYKSDVTSIYIIESCILGLTSIISALALSPLFSLVINRLISRFLHLNNLIEIPFSRVFNVPFFLPIILIILTLLVCVISTSLPISLAKRIELKEELADE